MEPGRSVFLGQNRDAAPPSAVVWEGQRRRRIDRRELARRELARRELARREFGAFAQYVYRGWPGEALHLQVLCETLQRVERYVATKGAEGIGRLMVFMPPRYWKSTTTTVLFPPWFLGRHPDKRVIIACYNASLALGFSRRARNLMDGPHYGAVFGERSGLPPVRLAEDSRSVEDWNLAGYHGGMAAAGVGGGITGKGADLFIIDDPHKDRREAESKTVREAVDEWYKSAAYTRLEEGGAMILIQTRWHSDDLAGRLLRRMVEDPALDQWTVLCLPAVAEEWALDRGRAEDAESAERNGLEIPRFAALTWNEGDGLSTDSGNGLNGLGGTEGAEGNGFGGKLIEALKAGWWRGRDALGRVPGEVLWPGKYPGEVLEATRGNIGGYEWDALYQQRPQRIEGSLIKAYDIQILDAGDVPEDLTEVRYWDLAVSGREWANFIAGARVGRGEDGRIYILDMARIPGPWADARAQMVEVMLSDPASVVQGIETAGQQAGYFQELQRDRKLQARVVVGVNPREVGSKEVRANVWASRIQDGLIYMVRAPWNDLFLGEAIVFPHGANDDQVDAVSGAVQMLADEEYGGPGVVPYA